MTRQTYELEFCMQCGEVPGREKDVCNCGSRNFIFGSNFTYDKKAVCGCGNSKFEMVSHMNMSPIFNKTYKCTSCDNHVGMQTYFESPHF